MRINASMILSSPYVSTPSSAQREGGQLRRMRHLIGNAATRLHRWANTDSTEGTATERIAEVPEFIRRVALSAPQTPILDVGCAGSLMPLHYIAMGYEVHGVDLRDPGVDVTGFRYIAGDAGSLDLDCQYDVITLLSTLEHCGLGAGHYAAEVTNDDFGVIRNLRRFLTPLGRFICSVPYGRPNNLGWYRVYDEERLLQVFGHIENASYYKFSNATWYPCDKDEIADRDTEKYVRSAIVFESSVAAGRTLG